MTDPIRVFIGAAPNGSDAESCAVAEYTLRKHASRPLEIHWAILSRDPRSFWYSNGKEGWQTARYPTPFSAFRWGVCEYFGFQGKAIYSDSDVIFRADIAELWDTEILPGKIVVAREPNRLCVSLWDCAAAKPHMLPLEKLQAVDGHQNMRGIINSRASLVQCFEPGQNWNCLDLERLDINDPSIKIIHYTDMSAQPHLKHAIPRLEAAGQRHWYDGPIREHWRKDLISLFDRTLAEAESNGFPRKAYIPSEMFGFVPKNSLVGHPGRHPR